MSLDRGDDILFRADEVRAAKEHRCAWCGETIDLGELHLSRAYMLDGDFRADRLHRECWLAMAMSDEDCFGEGWEFEPHAQNRGEPLCWDEE